MMEEKKRLKTVRLDEKHINFIDDRSRFFNLSRFVRDRLDEYIKFKESLSGNEKVEQG